MQLNMIIQRTTFVYEQQDLKYPYYSILSACVVSTLPIYFLIYFTIDILFLLALRLY